MFKSHSIQSHKRKRNKPQREKKEKNKLINIPHLSFSKRGNIPQQHNNAFTTLFPVNKFHSDIDTSSVESITSTKKTKKTSKIPLSEQLAQVPPQPVLNNQPQMPFQSFFGNIPLNSQNINKLKVNIAAAITDETSNLNIKQINGDNKELLLDMIKTLPSIDLQARSNESNLKKKTSKKQSKADELRDITKIVVIDAEDSLKPSNSSEVTKSQPASKKKTKEHVKVTSDSTQDVKLHEDVEIKSSKKSKGKKEKKNEETTSIVQELLPITNNDESSADSLTVTKLQPSQNKKDKKIKKPKETNPKTQTTIASTDEQLLDSLQVVESPKATKKKEKKEKKEIVSNSSLHEQEQEQQDVSETPTDFKELSNDKNKKQKQSKKNKTEQKHVALDQPAHEIVSSEVLQHKTSNSTINELNVKSSKKAKKESKNASSLLKTKSSIDIIINQELPQLVSQILQQKQQQNNLNLIINQELPQIVSQILQQKQRQNDINIIIEQALPKLVSEASTKKKYRDDLNIIINNDLPKLVSEVITHKKYRNDLDILINQELPKLVSQITTQKKEHDLNLIINQELPQLVTKILKDKQAQHDLNIIIEEKLPELVAQAINQKQLEQESIITTKASDGDTLTPNVSVVNHGEAVATYVGELLQESLPPNDTISPPLNAQRQKTNEQQTTAELLAPLKPKKNFIWEKDNYDNKATHVKTDADHPAYHAFVQKLNEIQKYRRWEDEQGVRNRVKTEFIHKILRLLLSDPAERSVLGYEITQNELKTYLKRLKRHGYIDVQHITNSNQDEKQSQTDSTSKTSSNNAPQPYKSVFDMKYKEEVLIAALYDLQLVPENYSISLVEGATLTPLHVEKIHDHNNNNKNNNNVQTSKIIQAEYKIAFPIKEQLIDVIIDGLQTIGFFTQFAGKFDFPKRDQKHARTPQSLPIWAIPSQPILNYQRDPYLDDLLSHNIRLYDLHLSTINNSGILRNLLQADYRSDLVKKFDFDTFYHVVRPFLESRDAKIQSQHIPSIKRLISNCYVHNIIDSTYGLATLSKQQLKQDKNWQNILNQYRHNLYDKDTGLPTNPMQIYNDDELVPLEPSLLKRYNKAVQFEEYLAAKQYCLSHVYKKLLRHNIIHDNPPPGTGIRMQQWILQHLVKANVIIPQNINQDELSQQNPANPTLKESVVLESLQKLDVIPNTDKNTESNIKTIYQCHTKTPVNEHFFIAPGATLTTPQSIIHLLYDSFMETSAYSLENSLIEM